jgi:hypothetical protein
MVHKFRRQVTSVISSPEKRAEIIREVAQQVWQPLQEPESRAKFITEVALVLWEPLNTPEKRQKLIGELGHGMLRALKEESGSMKGAAIRSEKAGLMDAALESGNALGVLGAIPGKIELPIVGKVTPAQALQLLTSLRSLFSGGQLQNLLPSGGSSSSGGSASSLP